MRLPRFDLQVAVVREQEFWPSLKAERELEKTLKMMLKTLQAHHSLCDAELKKARLEHGLPARPPIAQGYFDTRGHWIQTRGAAMSLD